MIEYGGVVVLVVEYVVDDLFEMVEVCDDDLVVLGLDGFGCVFFVIY